ncbi:MAG: hypothetical protein LBT88_04775 [Oscillospiraceae bacterium]|jgi:hypothetical protein|nr:hypothetical protein [Oscillospiraceae bacterium]
MKLKVFIPLIILISFSFLLSSCGGTSEPVPTETYAPAVTPAAEPNAEPSAEPTEVIAEPAEVTPVMLSWQNALDDEIGVLDDKVYTFPNGETRVYAADEYILLLDGAFTPARVIEQLGKLYIPADCYAELALMDFPTVEFDGELFADYSVVASLLGKDCGILPAWSYARFYEKQWHIEWLTMAYRRAMADNTVVWIDDHFEIDESALRTDLRQNLRQAYTLFEDYAFDNGLAGVETRSSAELGIILHHIEFADYLGSAGRFAFFSAPYTAIVDVQSGDTYFYSFAHLTGSVWKPDFYRDDLFLGGYYMG